MRFWRRWGNETPRTHRLDCGLSDNRDNAAVLYRRFGLADVVGAEEEKIMSTENKPQCACVHPDSHECAKIRDRRLLPRWPDICESDFRRKCECPCHDEHDESHAFWEE
jgi:hypothetical protein